MDVVQPLNTGLHHRREAASPATPTTMPLSMRSTKPCMPGWVLSSVGGQHHPAHRPWGASTLLVGKCDATVRAHVDAARHVGGQEQHAVGNVLRQG